MDFNLLKMESKQVSLQDEVILYLLITRPLNLSGATKAKEMWMML